MWLVNRLQGTRCLLDQSPLTVCFVSIFGILTKDELSSGISAEYIEVIEAEDLSRIIHVESDIVLVDPTDCLFWLCTCQADIDKLRASIVQVVKRLIDDRKIVILSSSGLGKGYLDHISTSSIKIKI